MKGKKYKRFDAYSSYLIDILLSKLYFTTFSALCSFAMNYHVAVILVPPYFSPEPVLFPLITWAILGWDRSKNHKCIWGTNCILININYFNANEKNSKPQKFYHLSSVVLRNVFHFINIWRRTKTNMVIVYHRTSLI